MMAQEEEIEQLREWFATHGRWLPWRENRTPYRVWVSEVMLQQTQASVVIPYFEKWMALYPTLEALAAAPLEQVLKVWEGLGYYSRARHLHAGAQQMISRWKGVVPSDPGVLAEIKGLGPYTIGAIRAFAFRQKAVAIDGNVSRVLARYKGIEAPIDSSEGKRLVREAADHFLADQEPWVVAEALIELGALVCKRSPECSICPLQQQCVARREGKERELPRKKGRAPITRLRRTVFVLETGEEVLLCRREAGVVMAGLYEFPYVEQGEELDLGGALFQKELPPIEHGFTRYAVTLYPRLYACRAKTEWKGCLWVSKREIHTKPFSAGHRKILDALGWR
jgi:A/G-specific adenine glycosylase